MNISKRKQGILAIICTIAMIVTSITVYNPREVKAAASGSGNGMKYTVSGESQEGGLIGFTCNDVKILSAVDGYMHFAWSGDDAYKVDTKTIKAQIDGVDVATYNSNPSDTFIAYSQFKGLEAGEHQIRISGTTSVGEAKEIYATATLTIEKVEGTTTGSSTKPFDPSTIKDSEWTLAKDSKTVSYYIADGKANKVTVTPQLRGDNCYYMAFALAAKFKSVTFDGVSKDVPGGADYEVKASDLTSGYHTLVVTDYYGKESVTIYFKVAKEEETTTTPYKDGEVLVNESNKTIEVPSYSEGDSWRSEYNNTPVKYVKGKKYVAEVVVSSTAAKEIKMVFQRNSIWDFVDSNSGYEVRIAAGNKVKITYVFEATQSTDDGNFDIHLGSAADATTLVFESKKLTTYNEVPDGVQTGVEVLEAPGSTEYTVSIDGKSQTCKEGATIAVPADGQGYYDVTKKKAYAPGAVLAVNENMTLKSIELNVTMTPGASIRLAAPTGLRFQTTVTSGNGIDADEILNSTTVTTGTLITSLDLYEANGKTLTKDSTYTVLDIANAGWFGEESKKETGKFCGSIIKIQKENYGRKFIAVGYATINYSNGKSKTVYAEVTENNAKSIKYVAEKVQASEKFSGYSAAQQDIIKKYIEGKEISK